MSVSKLSRERGKRAELGVAKYWGCKRAHFESNDLHGHPCFTFEVKCRKDPIVTIRNWMHQAQNAANCGAPGAVVFHVLGERFADDIVMIRAEDLRDLIGEGEYGTD
jgi:hypothetical protein